MIKERDETLQFHTTKEAIAFVNKLRGACFAMTVKAFLPTQDDGERGFDRAACVSVSKKQFVKVIRDVGETLVDQREGRIQIRVSTTTYEFGKPFTYVTLN